LEKSSTVQGLATRLIEKLTVDGPDFEKIYEAEGDLSAVYPTEYSGIDTSSSIDVSTGSTSTPDQEPSVPAAPAKEESTVTDAVDSDDSNDPGPSD
jgi:cell division protease FtsH